MNALGIKGQWNIAKGKLKQTLAKLTSDDVQLIQGREDELTGRIQRRTAQIQDRAVSAPRAGA